MKNRKHYIVEKNLNKKYNRDNTYIIIPDNEEQDTSKYYSGGKSFEEAQTMADEINSEYYITDYSDDELQEYFDNIDFSILEKKLNEFLEMDLTWNHSLILRNPKGRLTGYVNFESNEDLCQVNKYFAKIFKSCKIDNFFGGLIINKNTGELFLALNIDYKYNYYDGGSNEHSLLHADYKNNQWICEFNKDSFN